MGEIDPIDLLVVFLKSLIVLGIILLIGQGLYDLGNLMNKPITYIVSIIGNIVMNIFGLNIIWPFGTIAIIFFIAVGILLLSIFLNDEKKILAYETLTFIVWLIDGIITLAAYISYQSNPALLAPYIGFGFLGLIAPPFIYIIGKYVMAFMFYLFDFLFC
jgi:hypothetical protein